MNANLQFKDMVYLSYISVDEMAYSTKNDFNVFSVTCKAKVLSKQLTRLLFDLASQCRSQDLKSLFWESGRGVGAQDAIPYGQRPSPSPSRALGGAEVLLTGPAGRTGGGRR